MILVTVGTEQYPFNALMSWVDMLIRYQLIDPEEEIVVQYGASTELPDGVKVFRRLPEVVFRQLIDRSRLVIGHCGEGTTLLLESLGKPYVLVPRTQQYGEHVDDHQVEMADAVEKQGLAVARTPGDLVRFLAQPRITKQAHQDEDELCRVLGTLYNPENQPKIMLVCSSGGHFKPMQSLKPFWEAWGDNIAWVTFRTATTESELQSEKGEIYWAHHPTNRNIPNLIRNLFLAFKVVLKEKPDLVISTGAGVAVPFLLVAHWLCGSQTVFVELKTRVRQLSLSARLLKWLSGLSLVVVRNREMADRYPKALYVRMVDSEDSFTGQESSHIKPVHVRDTVLLNTPERLTTVESQILTDHLRAISQPAPKRIVLDMGATSFIDSAGLSALLSCLKTAKTIGSELVLWSVRSEVRSILEIARLDRMFTIESASQDIRTRPKTTHHLETSEKPQRQPVFRVPQQVVDAAAASVGMIALMLLFLPIALAVRLDGPGPVLVNRVRLGRSGKYIRIWKFRSIVSQPVTATGISVVDELLSQPTALSRFLCKTRLDRLPLFWNILKGELSLSDWLRSTDIGEIDCSTLLQRNLERTVERQTVVVTESPEFEDLITLD